MIDAETGEPIRLTKAKWNGREGRVNLDYQSILTTGTGALSIKEDDKLMLSTRAKHNTQCDSHPLVSKFLEDGPLTPIFHTRWNPRTGKVDPLPTLNVPKKKKKKKKVIQRTQVDDDDNSSIVKSGENSVELDPYAFLSQKRDLSSIVGLALSSKVAQSAPEASDALSEVSMAPSVPSLTSEDSDEEGPIDDAQREAMLRQNVFNQLYAYMQDVDAIRHPTPYLPSMTRAARREWKSQELERKLRLVMKCEDIAYVFPLPLLSYMVYSSYCYLMCIVSYGLGGGCRRDMRVRASRELRLAIADERAREAKRRVCLCARMIHSLSGICPLHYSLTVCLSVTCRRWKLNLRIQRQQSVRKFDGVTMKSVSGRKCISGPCSMIMR